MIVNTGSKQGITTPPGNLAYNVSKSALKTYTEGLAHALRNEPGAKISAHLLIPGFTFTGDQSLVSLARFYGFSLNSVAKNTTMDQFLARCCRGLPYLGFHLPLGLFELVVLEVKEGHVSKVGLRLGSSPGEQQVPETAWRSDADAPPNVGIRAFQHLTAH